MRHDKQNLPTKIAIWLMALPAFFATLFAEERASPTLIMPLEEVEAGMRGEWHTVVQGTKVETFAIRVLGVARNFAGPKRSVIICEALGGDQILNGPVSGMSGSPVYIDGKLIGAYAYGYNFAKEQAIIGVQPINSMLETWDESEAKKTAAQTSGSRSGKTVQKHLRQNSSVVGDTRQASEWRMARGKLPATMNEESLTTLRPLPVAMVSSGFSARTIQFLRSEFEKLGLRLVQGAGGGSLKKDFELEAGKPVAAVLMSGDFSIAATGTVTYREGDRVLAFGHPLFQWGRVDIPMAGAEVITIVRSIISSFKLSQPGKVTGTIESDRQTAIAGTTEKLPHMIEFEMKMNSVNSEEQGTSSRENSNQQHFYAQLMQDYQFSPLLLTLAMMEGINSSLQRERQQTVRITSDLQFDGYEPVQWQSLSARNQLGTVFEFYNRMRTVMDNPFAVPQLDHVQFEIEIQPGWHAFTLRSSELLNNGEINPGQTLHLRYALQPSRGKVKQEVISFELPNNLTAGKYELLLADSSMINALKYGNARFRSDFDDAGDYIRNLGKLRSNDGIYVILTRSAPGLSIDGQQMRDLPGSVISLLNSSSSGDNSQIYREVIKTHKKPLKGLFRGGAVYEINIQP